MDARPVGQAEYECPLCGTIKEGKNGAEHRCDSCGVVMVKLFGGRANSGHKDLRWRDQ